MLRVLHLNGSYANTLQMCDMRQRLCLYCATLLALAVHMPSPNLAFLAVA